MEKQEIVKILAQHGIGHKYLEGEIYAENMFIKDGKKLSVWFPVTDMDREHLLDWIID